VAEYICVRPFCRIQLALGTVCSHMAICFTINLVVVGASEMRTMKYVSVMDFRYRLC